MIHDVTSPFTGPLSYAPAAAGTAPSVRHRPISNNIVDFISSSPFSFIHVNSQAVEADHLLADPSSLSFTFKEAPGSNSLTASYRSGVTIQLPLRVKVSDGIAVGTRRSRGPGKGALTPADPPLAVGECLAEAPLPVVQLLDAGLTPLSGREHFGTGPRSTDRLQLAERGGPHSGPTFMHSQAHSEQNRSRFWKCGHLPIRHRQAVSSVLIRKIQ